jgi:hypothetical protein
MRHPRIIQKEKCALLVIDIQQKILPVIFENERVIANSLKLINGFKIMKCACLYYRAVPERSGSN